MTLTEFIEKIKIERTLDIDTNKCEEYITERARERAKKSNCVALSNDEVELIIIDFANAPAEKKVVEEEAEDGKQEDNKSTKVEVFKII